MDKHEYSPGEVVPVTSALYRVMHDPPKYGVQMQTFYAGDTFPPCSECGNNVRYQIPITVLRAK